MGVAVIPGGLVRVGSLGNHMQGAREIPLGAKALGNGVGEIQGVSGSWLGPGVLLLVLPRCGELGANG